jgi:hypothetical protein
MVTQSKHPVHHETQLAATHAQQAPAFNPLHLPVFLTLVSLSLISLITTVDISSIAIALPRISSTLNAGGNYVWMANCYAIAQTVVQLPLGQICDIFGRRWPMMVSVVLFAIGSGIAGGAANEATLITGRTIQGIGAGGINVLVELILCDLIPLRERSKYFGIVLSASAVGTIVGPVLGGALADRNWRWIFYLNIPVAGVVFITMLFTLRLRYVKEPSIAQALRRIDWIGSGLFMASLFALLFGVVSGGITYAWSSWHVILPIVLGIAGWISFHIYETTRFCEFPCMPPRLFDNRTANAGFILTFISSMLLMWVSFLWPVYFQALHNASPTRAGIDMLPFVVCLIPSSILAGIALSHWGVYRPIHVFSLLLGILGPALNTMLTERTSVPAWAAFQMVDAVGRGALFPCILPAILASLDEFDVATATSMFSFLRSFGFVWGVTVPALIFNSSFNRNSYRILDTTVRSALSGGRAYELVGTDFVRGLPDRTRGEVMATYVEALKATWVAATAFGVMIIGAVIVEKHIPLRTELVTQYGIEKDGSQEQSNPPITLNVA